MSQLEFFNTDGSFHISHPEHLSSLYFPIAGEKGIKGSITPTLGGDIKLNQNAFILEPVSIENLHNNMSSRNFWVNIKGKGCWSITGQSAQAICEKFTDEQDDCEIAAGLMWHKLLRINKKYGIEAEITSFVPVDSNVEVTRIELTNATNEDMEIIPTAAVPIYGRSADNIRDHRHVTSLLHRIKTTDYGVLVKPTLSFDERGHQKNNLTYFVCGITGEGKKPVSFYPTVEEFIGDGGSFLKPRAVYEEYEGVSKDHTVAGKEAMGGIRFDTCVIKAFEKVTFTIVVGATDNEAEIGTALLSLASDEDVEEARKKTDEYWQKQVNVAFKTGDDGFDNFMRWVSFQPFLRRIYGCSFLPHHDYGKGGRGWRDLWQDCLALLMMNPSGVRTMILDNFGGVRIDGSNATIIGANPGEFIADRNNITRVWMDHGYWPLLTTKLYIDETGDIDILNQKVTYFKDKQVERGTAIDTEWSSEYGNKQKTIKGEVYEGTVLEHLLLQNLCAFYEVGKHNIIRLRGADWNDAMDMAEENGESVAFTAAYAGNLRLLAKYIRDLKRNNNKNFVELMSEIVELLGNDKYLNGDVTKKNSTLSKYEKLCRHEISGAKMQFDAELLAKNLESKADWMVKNIRENEWVTDKKGNGWFNSYYDNNGRQVEGEYDNTVKMILTGQVFALMSKVATPMQARSIIDSADAYLYEKEIGGYRINTDFNEERYDMGRMFGFAYGEKENGAVFSHMTVMFANALYQNGFVKEGYKALKTLADASIKFETSHIYPGIPEYFNNEGRGMYAYLTGAASWYMMTMITEAFGVKGEMGNLVIEPKLVKEQFDENGNASLKLEFDGKEFEVCFMNSKEKDYGEYDIKDVECNFVASFEVKNGKVLIAKEVIDKLEKENNIIKINLG